MMTTEQIEQIGHDLGGISDRANELIEDNKAMREALEEIADLWPKYKPAPDADREFSDRDAAWIAIGCCLTGLLLGGLAG